MLFLHFSSVIGVIICNKEAAASPSLDFFLVVISASDSSAFYRRVPQQIRKFPFQEFLFRLPAAAPYFIPSDQHGTARLFDREVIAFLWNMPLNPLTERSSRLIKLLNEHMRPWYRGRYLTLPFRDFDFPAFLASPFSAWLLPPVRTVGLENTDPCATSDFRLPAKFAAIPSFYAQRTTSTKSPY